MFDLIQRTKSLTERVVSEAHNGLGLTAKPGKRPSIFLYHTNKQTESNVETILLE